MSGGADSSTCAALLLEQGHDVVGLTARMWKGEPAGRAESIVESARKVAAHLGISHFVLDASDVFENEVVSPFVMQYVRGETPNPCVVCNYHVKFGFLLAQAMALDCDALATGHYARISCGGNLCRLLKGNDPAKDQSYFLCRLTQSQLGMAMFPLGEMFKDRDVIPYAKKRGLPVNFGSESADVCFIEGDIAEFIRSRAGDHLRDGQIVDSNGAVLGTHNGLHRFTIGQRRGLGIAQGHPVYVTGLDTARNLVRVGPHDETMRDICLVRELQWISGSVPDLARSYDVRIRYRQDPAPAKLSWDSNGLLRVSFDDPQFAVTPGQAAAIYDGDEVLGGGWIAASAIE